MAAPEIQIAAQIAAGALTTQEGIERLMDEARCDEITARRALAMELGAIETERVDELTPVPEYGL